MSVNDVEVVNGDHGDSVAQVGLTPRSYQLEMLVESMRHNIIIAMDTGSGKTLIATLRIQAELERCAAEKLVWFCVPTVALAEQQHQVISSQLTAYQSRVLSGKDNCQFWTKQTWTDVLTDTRICVSTHDILLDALVHGFVNIEQIALLIFDEAHKATKNHSSNRIMQSFYHPTPDECRPSILGLTASPVINDKVDNLDKLESNLNAISRTPKLHRSELLTHVHLPQLIQVFYRPYDEHEIPLTSALLSLRFKYEDYNLNEDPWIIKMQNETDPQCDRWLTKAITKKITQVCQNIKSSTTLTNFMARWCREQLLDLCKKAEAIAVTLGPWAIDLYIYQCIQKFRNVAVDSFTIEDDVQVLEKLHLRNLFDSIGAAAPAKEDLKSDYESISPKVGALIDFLKSEDTATFSGLVFVQTRAEVAILSQLLMAHTSTKSFNVGTFVGESGYSGRKLAVGELADIRNQKTTLDDLRLGKKNLIVTTNALEEGIDVSACNVVVCFEKPPNLKSFVQRRGRARKRSSKYAILLDPTKDSHLTLKWLDLEAMMKEIYSDHMRELQRLQALEDEESGDSRELYIPETGYVIHCLSLKCSHV